MPDHTRGRPINDRSRRAWSWSSLSRLQETYRETISSQSMQELRNGDRDVGSCESSTCPSPNEKSRPETGRHSKQKVYQAWMEPACESSRHQCRNNPACSVSVSANSRIGRLELARRQLCVFGLRNERYHEAQQPIHASRMAFPPILPVVTPHLRAYRFGTAGMLLHLVPEGELRTRCGNRSKLRIE